MKLITLVALILLSALNINSQNTDSLNLKVYNVRPIIDISVTAVGAATNYWGLRIVDKKSRLDSTTLSNLDPNSVNRFDRRALEQDTEYAETARTISDYGMTVSFMLPVLLMIDQEIRTDWFDLLVLYLETEAITGNLFSWGAAIHIDRIRPIAYYPNIPYGDRTYKRNKNSFYSGHTSSSAAASFFMAKVYTDYHPELGNKKYLIFTAALIPPAFTGYHRIRGLKHFPTDVMMGIAVGAGAGILIPHLHKNKNNNLAILPFAGEYTGMAMSLKF